MNANLIPLAVAGIVASVIGAYYYIMIIKTMYFDDKSDTEIPASGGVIVEDAVITASALWLSVIGYLFIPVLAVFSASAAAVLF